MTRSMRDWTLTDNNGSEASTRSMFRERVQAKHVAGDLAIYTTNGIVVTPSGKDRMEAKDEYKFR